jgi:hypothetical protein
VVVVANRVRCEADLAAVRAALGQYELAIVPEDEAITRAERDGRAPVDGRTDAPAVRALSDLAERLVAM